MAKRARPPRSSFPKHAPVKKGGGVSRRLTTRTMSDIEHSVFQLAERLAARDVKLDIFARLLPSKSVVNLSKNLAAAQDALDRNLGVLAMAATARLQERVVSRARTNPMIMETGTESSERTEKILPDITNVLSRQATKLGNAKYGFGDISALDAIKISDYVSKRIRGHEQSTSESGVDKDPNDEAGSSSAKQYFDLEMTVRGKKRSGSTGTTSPFVQAWKVIEFGTGVFADRKITSGYAKVQGGGGAWFWNPRTRSGVTLGQKGAHFLVPHRENADEFRADERFLQEYLLKFIERLINPGE